MRVSPTIIKCLAMFFVGVIMGALGYHMLRAEGFYIDSKVDLGSIIAMTALAVSVSVTPFVIDRRLNRQRNYESGVWRNRRDY